MNSISDKNKLKLAKAMYILVVAVMLYLAATDSLRNSFIKKDKDNSAHPVLSNLQAPMQFKMYSNLKYGFKIDYPSDFEMHLEEMYGSGASFLAKDKQTKLTVYGSDNVPYEPIEMLYKKDLSVIDGEVKLKSLSKQWYEISWIKNHVIYYRKVAVGTEALNSIIFSYPESSSSKYNSMLEHLLSSYKHGDLDSAH